MLQHISPLVVAGLPVPSELGVTCQDGGASGTVQPSRHPNLLIAQVFSAPRTVCEPCSHQSPMAMGSPPTGTGQMRLEVPSWLPAHGRH